MHHEFLTSEKDAAVDHYSVMATCIPAFSTSKVSLRVQASSSETDSQWPSSTNSEWARHYNKLSLTPEDESEVIKKLKH